jgi:hypothetical protein
LEHGGAEVEAFFDRVAEKIRPAKGQAWDSLEHRHADTLIGMCRLETPADGSGTGRCDEDRAQAPTMAVRPMFVLDVPLHGPALLCGIPTPARAPGAHLQPSSWGGTDDIANLAAVCPSHHALLVPHGELVLDGNPNQPDGLTLRRITPAEDRRRQRAPSAA